MENGLSGLDPCLSLKKPKMTKMQSRESAARKPVSETGKNAGSEGGVAFCVVIGG
jgi:hypothetical protein